MITYIIIALTAYTSYRAFSNYSLFDKMKFNAYDIVHNKKQAKLFTHALIHADWNHLIFNMLTLFFFGPTVESVFVSIWGTQGIFYFILFYISAIAASSFFSLFKYKDVWSYNAVGASGAISAVLFAFILFAPTQKLYLFFALPIPGYIYGVAYLLYSYQMSKRGSDNIGHDAHFWGAVYGFMFPILLKPSLFERFFNQLF